MTKKVQKVQKTKKVRKPRDIWCNEYHQAIPPCNAHTIYVDRTEDSFIRLAREVKE